MGVDEGGQCGEVGHWQATISVEAYRSNDISPCAWRIPVVYYTPATHTAEVYYTPATHTAEVYYTPATHTAEV